MVNVVVAIPVVIIGAAKDVLIIVEMEITAILLVAVHPAVGGIATPGAVADGTTAMGHSC